MSKTLKINNRTIKVISPEMQESSITAEDADMDNRAKNAVRAAINRAQVCKKPIARYDAKTKKVYIENANGN